MRVRPSNVLVTVFVGLFHRFHFIFGTFRTNLLDNGRPENVHRHIFNLPISKIQKNVKSATGNVSSWSRDTAEQTRVTEYEGTKGNAQKNAKALNKRKTKKQFSGFAISSISTTFRIFTIFYCCHHSCCCRVIKTKLNVHSTISLRFNVQR